MKFSNEHRILESIHSTCEASKSTDRLKSLLKILVILFLLVFSVYLFIALNYSLNLKKVLSANFASTNRNKVKHLNYRFHDSPFSYNLSDRLDDHQTVDKSIGYKDIENDRIDSTSLNRGRSKRSVLRKRTKPRKRRASSKRKVKRFVFRIDYWPFPPKLFSTSKKIYRKRFVRRNVRSSLSSRSLHRPRNKWHRTEKTYSNDEIARLSLISNKEVESFNLTLEKILKVRVPGTQGHREVNEFIVNSMQDLGWSVEEDVFNDETPLGEITFRNIIATHNPKSCKRLVFACHYDSKYFKSGKFLGATDSAVPCALMIEIARNLRNELERKKNNDISLQFIFFDGEEAFKKWTDTDSIYGARHLAAKWNRQQFPAKEQDKSVCSNKKLVSELDRIELLVLLDLLGTPFPNFYSFFPQTSSVFKRLLQIESRLNKLKLMETHLSNGITNYFQPRQMNENGISDDHVPFLKLDVDVLHIIPYPFPKVWHKLADNRDALHQPTISNLMKIFQLFISSYLHL